MTVNDLVESWITDRADRVAPRTLEQYNYVMAAIPPLLGRVDVEAVTPQLVAEALERLADRPRLADLAHLVLSAALGRDQMPRWRRLSTRRPLDVWTDAELDQYRDALPGHAHGVALALGVYMGLRRGEILGCRWSDFDRATGCLVITRQRHCVGGRLIVAPCKTATSRRIVPMPPPVVEMWGGRSDGGYVCELTPSGLYQAHVRLVQALGLRHMSLHGLRHCMASQCVRRGASIPALQRVLGHASASVTMDIYTHPDISSLTRCVSLTLNQGVQGSSP